MASLGTVSYNLSLAGVQKFTRQAGNAASSVKKIQKGFLAMTAAAGATAFALKKLADASGEFEQGLAAVGSVSKATAKDMKLLEDAAIGAGLATQFSPTQAVDGLLNLATAGQTATQATETLIPVLNLAAGSLGQLGVGEAATAVVGTLNTYSMGADKAAIVTDKLLRITQLTNFQTKDFAAGLSKASARTKGYGQSLDDTLIAMGLLRNANIDASSASTAYSMGVARVATNTQALNALQKAGVSLYDNQTGKVRSFLDLVTELSPKLAEMTDEQKNLNLTQIFGAQAIVAYNAIAAAKVTVEKDGIATTLKGAAAIKHMRQNMTDAGGTAKEFTDALLDTYQGQKTLLAGSLETLAVISGKEFANAFRPFVENAIEAINKAIKFIKNLSDEQKKGIAESIIFWTKWTGIIGGVGFAITALFGPISIFLGLMGKIILAIKTMRNARLSSTIAGWGSSLGKLKGPLTTAARYFFSLKTAALGAVAATAYAMNKSINKIRDHKQELADLQAVRNRSATAEQYERFRVSGSTSDGNIEARIANSATGRFGFRDTGVNLNDEVSFDETNLAKVQARYKAINDIIEEQLELRKRGRDGLQQMVVTNGKNVGLQKISLEHLQKRADRLRVIASNINEDRNKQKTIETTLSRQTEILQTKARLSGQIADNADREQRAVVATFKKMSVGEKVLARARAAKAKREDQARVNASIRRKPEQASGPAIRTRRKLSITEVGRASVAAPYVPGQTKMGGAKQLSAPEQKEARAEMRAAAAASKALAIAQAQTKATLETFKNGIMSTGEALLSITGSLTSVFSGQLPAIMASAGSALFGPIGGAVGSVVDTLFGQSEQGKKAAGALKQVAEVVGQVLAPVFDALIPIVGLLGPLFKALFTAFRPIIQLVADVLFPVLQYFGVLLTNVGIFLSYFQLALLKFANLFGDYGDDIDRVEGRIAGQVAARNELLNMSVSKATEAVNAHAEASQDSAEATQANANAARSANAVGWYNAARTAYGADTGIASGMANDFISRPGQPLQKFSSADTVMGFNGNGPLGGQSGGATYEIGEVHIHGVDDPESFWQKIEEAITFNVVRGGTALPTSNRWGGI